jgi:hypothetical protein
MLRCAQCWAPDPSRSSVAGSADQTPPQTQLVTVEELSVNTDPSLLPFLESCASVSILAGEGLVGSAFAHSRVVFSPDVQTLTPMQYPLFAFARQFDLHASVAVGVSLVRICFHCVSKQNNVVITHD